jgi:hypothetical protein
MEPIDTQEGSMQGSKTVKKYEYTSNNLIIIYFSTNDLLPIISNISILRKKYFPFITLKTRKRRVQNKRVPFGINTFKVQ